MEKVVVNKEVVMSGVYFKNKQTLEAFPKQMEFEGQTYQFLNSGLRFLIHKGQEIVRIFSVTDGQADYRLKLEPGSDRWTLLDIRPDTAAQH